MYDNAKKNAFKSLIRSKDRKDQQFVNLFRIRQALRYGVEIGFKGFDYDSKEEEANMSLLKSEKK